MSKQWLIFCNFSISHSVRNIWFRALHGKLPIRSSLYRFFSHAFPSSTCIICSTNSIDTDDHFLLTCSLKTFIWPTL
ncbi:MAG: hypothetical protein EXX96DRAFT_550733 [Benjaminiella poitrasii]|nr:MAG: hypothetical protein EXX96DRAFT_550733 [Benjaminiella poitrasii]